MHTRRLATSWSSSAGTTVLATIIALAFAGRTTAQVVVERVLHLWVDPLYGDDSKALQIDPGPACVNDCGTGAIAHDYYYNQYGFDWTVRWTHAVIHLLPGIYDPDGAGYDEGNGLRRNGERFPIWLPPRVSIQGTSALNTVLDLDAEASASSNEPDESYVAFEFGVYYDPIYGAAVPEPYTGGVPVNGEDCFIDSVTIERGGKGGTPGVIWPASW